MRTDIIIALSIFNIQVVIISISFFYSIKIRNYKNDPYLLKYIFYYNLVLMFIMTPMFLFTNLNLISPIILGMDIGKLLSKAIQLNNYSIIFGYLFLGNYMLKIMSYNSRNIGLRIFYLLIFIAIVYCLFFTNSQGVNYIAFSFNHFGLMILSVFFINNLLRYSEDENIFKNPLFWIGLGVLFCSAVNLPFSLLADTFIKNLDLKFLLYFLCYIPPICYSVMYLCFIKGLLCKIQE